MSVSLIAAAGVGYIVLAAVTGGVASALPDFDDDGALAAAIVWPVFWAICALCAIVLGSQRLTRRLHDALAKRSAR